MRPFVLALALAATALTLAPGAAADPPTFDRSIVDRTVVDYWSCPFPVTLWIHGDVREMLVDGERLVSRRHLEVAFSANGRTLTTSQSFMSTERETTQTFVGLIHNVNVPGEGVVMLTAGRVVFDLVGGTVLLDSGPGSGVSALCTFLAA